MHSKKTIKCTSKRIDALKMEKIRRYWTCFSTTRVLAPGASGNAMCVADTSGGMPWMFAWFYGDSGMDKATDTTMVLLQQPDLPQFSDVPASLSPSGLAPRGKPDSELLSKVHKVPEIS